MISSFLLCILHEDGLQHQVFHNHQKHVRSLLLQSCYNAWENTCRVFWGKAINILMYFPKEIQSFLQLNKSVFKLYKSSWYCASVLQVIMPIPIACVLSLPPDGDHRDGKCRMGFFVCFVCCFFSRWEALISAEVEIL